MHVYFPAADAAPEPMEPRISGQQPRGGDETILLVEDDDAVRRAGRRVLERYGYTVLEASDGEEALRIFQERRGTIDLVICDQVMPKLSGDKLYEAVRRLAPDQRFMLTSGYRHREDPTAGLRLAHMPFLPKPWDVSVLLVRVRRILDSPPDHASKSSSA